MNRAIELVLTELEEAGFQRLPKPLVVAGASFDFDAAVTGTVVSHDLVVVGSRDADSVRLIQLLLGLNRSLDRVASQRPVSLILLGSRPESDVLSELENNARVMIIESHEPEPADVRDAIAVLLPLHLPATSQAAIDPLNELLRGLGDEVTDEHRVLVDLARIGPESVREAFQVYLEDSLGQGNSGETDQ